MQSRLLALLPLTLALGLACERGSSSAAVTPEPIDNLQLFDSYGDLLTTVLTALRTGDVAGVRSMIASEGQVATMCPGYTVSTGGPYDPPSIEVAAAHCQEVFAPIPEDALRSSLETDDHGIHLQPAADGRFDNYREQCPGMEVYMLMGIFEVHGDGLPQAGLEVNGVYTYDGRWGLMNIPRCRGEGE